MAGYAPTSLKQKLFMESDATITVFGGAAGSGKSFTGLMDTLKWVHDPLFRGVVFRRTTPQLTGSGGMFDEANKMYNEALHQVDPKAKLKISRKDLKFTFPSKAEILMQHMNLERDKLNIQGWQIGYALVDEATQFLESQIMYIISRLRTDAKMSSHLKMTCNPDADSYLRHWLDDAGYLDKDGMPIEARSGVKICCGVIDGKMTFRETHEEWSKDFPSAGTPMTFTFIPATCRDNPVLLKNEPDYLSKLQNLPRIERARLLDGNWHVRETASGFFKREWCGKPISLYDVPREGRTVRGWDLAASLPSEIYPDPDYTVGIKCKRNLEDGTIYVLDMKRFRARPSRVQQNIEDAAEYDGRDTTVVIPRDAGASGKFAADRMSSELFSLGFTVRQKSVSNTGKGKRFEPVSALAENGMIKVVKGDWNEAFFNELESFTGESKSRTHDDIPDALADAIAELMQKRVIGNFTLPAMGGLTKTNPYKL